MQRRSADHEVEAFFHRQRRTDVPAEQQAAPGKLWNFPSDHIEGAMDICADVVKVRGRALVDQLVRYASEAAGCVVDQRGPLACLAANLFEQRPPAKP